MQKIISTFATFVAALLVVAPANAGVWQILSRDGEMVAIYSAGPADADQAIILVHDWFGMTPFITDAVDRLAGLGYRVAAADLYNGETAATHQEAWALMQGLEPSAAASVIDAAVSYLTATERDRDLALMGFSMGVPFAIDAARRNNASAVAVWYGDTALENGEAEALDTPILAIYGELDGNAQEEAEALWRAIGDAGGRVETHVYPGVGHAFAQPLFNGGDNFDEGTTQASWTLTEEFFARYLVAN